MRFLNTLDSRLRRDDGLFAFIVILHSYRHPRTLTVIPAQAGIQFVKLSLIQKHLS